MAEMTGCCLDLDHTLLHMLKKSEMPARAEELSEDVVSFSGSDGTEYSVCLRIGATSLVTALCDAGVHVVIVTCNLLGEKVMDALGQRCDVFKGLSTHIVTSRDKGAKSLVKLKLAFDRVVILDDSKQAWCAEDMPFVFTANKFDVIATLAADDEDAEDAEMGYLTGLRDEFLNFFKPPAIDWSDADSLPPDTPRDGAATRKQLVLDDSAESRKRARSLSAASFAENTDPADDRTSPRNKVLKKAATDDDGPSGDGDNSGRH